MKYYEEKCLYVTNYKGFLSIVELCLMVGISRSGYYKWMKNSHKERKAEKDKTLLNKMLSIYNTHAGTLGNERMKNELEKAGIKVSVKRIARMRRDYHMPLKTSHNWKQKSKPHAIIGNLLNRNFKAKRPGIKLCIDITYLEVERPYRHFLYLCAIKDLCHGEVVAYSISDTMTTSMVLQAVDQLLEKGLMEKNAILHSDQGSQFTSARYLNYLYQNSITPSMSRRGNCWDNACIESFFGKLKVEMPCFIIPKTDEEMIKAVENYISYYNNVRPQLKSKKTPKELLLEMAS
ncbi:IS3 family transposase [Paenisporosarcina cavernae]|uniref:IS3 family transposase n=1 Tax=Paenisporosarcina cavernae TaxID=2320858 RepID=UPI0013C43272|nr:IS3 family transposase [Paenisporosarcina cavernae]